MNTTLKQWLSDRRRKYSDGVDLFENLASDEMKRKFLNYFREVNTVPQFDSHFTVLINKLTSISSILGVKPVVMRADVAATTLKAAVDVAMADEKKSSELKGDTVLKDILSKEEELFSLRERLHALEENNEEKSDEIEVLQAELDSLTEELEELQIQFQTLRPGAKIMTYSALPKEIQALFDRVREITPLYASLFTEMQNENLSPEDRAPIASQVYDLWTERSSLWNKIDDWAEGKQISLKLEEKRMDELPTNQVLKGMHLANRIDRLKENIRRSAESIDKHKKNGKENLRLKAESRLSEYQKELAELESVMK